MGHNLLTSSLYLNKITLSKEIPQGNYLRKLPVISNLKEMGELRFTKPVTFLIGENGVGKSTLIEGIAVAMGFNPEGGSRNYVFSTYDSHSELYDALRIQKGFQRAGAGYF